jgi:hypothetical protein
MKKTITISAAQEEAVTVDGLGVRKLNAGKVLYVLTAVYLALPFCIFAFGWMKWWFAVPLVLVVAMGLIGMINHAPALWVPKLDRSFWWRFALVAILVVGWVLMSGVGRFTWQNDDHDVRNALFRILVENSWPVVELVPPEGLYDGPVALVYYIGFWLPSALVGKFFGLAAGNIAQVVWAVLGILLFCWLALAATLKKPRVWPVVIFILFSGMDILGCWVTGSFVDPITSAAHLERWGNPFQLSSMSTQLFWVYNQAIPAWVSTALILLQKNNRCLAFIVALTALSSTLPAMGMVPLVIFVTLRNLRDTDARPATISVKSFFKSVITYENVICGGMVGVVSLLYLSSNNAGQHIGLRAALSGTNLLMWLLLLMFEVGVLFLLLFKFQRKNPLYWVILGSLVIFPWVGVGNGGDFGMRATIPALVVLYFMVVMALAESFFKKQKLMFAGLCAVLTLGAVTAKNEIVRPMTMGAKLGSGSQTVERHPFDTTWSDNFYGNMENSFFFEYLVKDS